MGSPSLADILKEEASPPAAAPPAAAPPGGDLSRILQGTGAASAPAAAEEPAPGLTTDKTVVVPGATTTIPRFLTHPSEPGEIPSSEVPHNMIKNFLPSIGRVIDTLKEGEAAGSHAMGKTVSDPVGAFKAARDELAKILPNLPGHLVNIGALITQNLLDRYGSWAKVKETLSNDPGGATLDILGMMPPGAIEGLTGKVASTVGHGVGSALDVASQGLHGVGPGALTQMFESGQKITPDVWRTLTQGMDREAVHGQLKDALGDLLHRRASNYDAVMSQVEGSTTPLDFDKIDDAVAEAGKIRTYRPPGSNKTFMIEQDPGVKDMRGKILALVEQYRGYGPEFHTAFGLDKLKQAIYSLAESSRNANGMPTAASMFADKVAGGVKDTIMKEAPVYGKAMENWQNDSNQIGSIMKEFSIGPGTDESKQMTAIRKLQQVWRDTALSGHEQRNDLLRKVMEKTGNETLMPQLAADQYHSILRRGLGRYLPMIPLAEMVPHLFMGNPEAALISAGTGLGTGLATSPRLAGVGAYGLGRASSLGPVRQIPSVVRNVERYGPRAGAGLHTMTPPPPPPQEEGELPGRARGGYFATNRGRRPSSIPRSRPSRKSRSR